MSILDDAIREHLELKRAHGADATELKKLEDEAFGPPGRPDEQDPLAEAPTEFLGAPGAAEEATNGEPEKGARRMPNIADLQEAPPAEEAAPADAEPDGPRAAEEQPAMEHQAVPAPQPEPDADPQPEPSHSTAERHAIAEQPTELFDVEADAEPGSAAPGPSDEELIDAELAEPRLAPVDPLAAVDAGAAELEIPDEPAAEEEEEDDFFSEQRLSDELSQALDAPVTDEHEALGTEEHELPAETGEHEVAEGDTGEHEYEDAEDAEDDDAEYEDDEEEPAAGTAAQREDVLEDTPDFLEDAPEDDNLWFEQRPPKDFDFDD
jgi:hypothetical protein